jgi:hypothetical protein
MWLRRRCDDGVVLVSVTTGGGVLFAMTTTMAILDYSRYALVAAVCVALGAALV